MFGWTDVDYFVIIKEYIFMNTYKEQSINSFMTEVPVVQKPVHTSFYMIGT